MPNQRISGKLFKQMVTNGAVHLKNNHKEIDHLNVFPVPDGDTGTNMQMTMMAGIKEIINAESASIVDVSKILSRGLLMGARGNSGVILSQFFRGVYSEIAKIDEAYATVEQFIQALVGGYQMAYRAVMDPVEGTILTVVRESAERVLRDKSKYDSVEKVMAAYLKQANQSLQETPNLLPVLKEAGVVDSGGAGFIKIVEGMIMALEGQMLSEEAQKESHEDYHGAHNLGDVEITYGYCTEFIIKLHDEKNFNPSDLRDPLNAMGDSLVFVQDEDLLKVHIHTDEPGVAITLGQKYGDLQTLKADNMRLQNATILGKDAPAATKKPAEKKAYAILAVASGEGIKKAYKDLGIDIIIDGGQTMNPSTESFVNAIENANAEHVIILPNNKNIILSAEQTIDLLPERSISVIKTKNIGQGYATMIAFDPTVTLDENLEAMKDVADNMTYGEITFAVRDTEIKGVKINNGDYMAIAKGQILAAEKTKYEAAQRLLDNLIDSSREIITIFYGKDYEEEELEQIVAYAKKCHPDIEVDMIEGKQDIYTYVFAVE
ncbi:MAG: DAK2 domain-containing protein [Acholeplasmataceae bacterium]